MSDKRIESIVIVGGGTAGWMAAASLKNHLRNVPVEMTLIESSGIGTVGVGEATIPSIRRFYRQLGMSDFDVMRATQATCKLGIEFQDWYKTGTSYFHPFGLFGHDLNNVPFHHFWMRLKQAGDTTDISEYSLAVALAKKHRFTQPPRNPTSPLSIFDWALHFDAALFARHIQQYATSSGVKWIDAKIVNVNLRSADGFIESVTLENGQNIKGDLFIDCSGFRGILIEDALKTGYEDWSHWLQCDRAVAVQSELIGEAPPYTRSIARQAGWQWKIPLQHRQGSGYVYASSYISDEEAADMLVNSTEGKLLNEPRVLRFSPGRRKKAWNKNCIALGLAAGFLEPLESTSIALIETGIDKIKLLFPDKDFQQGCIDEFNTMTQLEYERVRDFIILHYKATAREDAPLWRYCREMDIPDTLEYKIRLFKERGHLVKYRWEIFQAPSWIAIYTGNNLLPDTYDPMVDNYSEDYLRRSFAEMRKSLIDAAENAPSHGEFVMQNAVARA